MDPDFVVKVKSTTFGSIGVWGYIWICMRRIFQKLPLRTCFVQTYLESIDLGALQQCVLLDSIFCERIILSCLIVYTFQKMIWSMYCWQNLTFSLLQRKGYMMGVVFNQKYLKNRGICSNKRTETKGTLRNFLEIPAHTNPNIPSNLC